MNKFVRLAALAVGVVVAAGIVAAAGCSNDRPTPSDAAIKAADQKRASSIADAYPSMSPAQKQHMQEMLQAAQNSASAHGGGPGGGKPGAGH